MNSAQLIYRGKLRLSFNIPSTPRTSIPITARSFIHVSARGSARGSAHVSVRGSTCASTRGSTHASTRVSARGSAARVSPVPLCKLCSVEELNEQLDCKSMEIE